MIAVRKPSRHTHSMIELGLSASWLRYYVLPAPSGRDHVHAVGFQLLPVGFESDRNFNVVDYKIGPRLSLSIPLLDWPLLLWHDLIRMPRGFLPPTASVGYSYVYRIRPSGEDLPDRQRIDGEVAVVAPLLRPLDLAARYRFFFDTDDEGWETFTELSWRWQVAEDTRTAVLLKLVHGALPPLFNDVEMVGLGFELEL
jgi:hypothetical protein